MPRPFGFHPYIRQGNVAVIGKLPARGQFNEMPYSIRHECSFVFECPFSWGMDDEMTLEELFRCGHPREQWRRAQTVSDLLDHYQKIEMRVILSRNNSLLRHWHSPNPYTDEFLILVGFDDLVSIILSC